MIEVRPYSEKDLEDIARIHTRVWQQAYAGQIPQDYLDKIDPAMRLAKWREHFKNSEKDDRYGTLLALVDGVKAGFMSYGPGQSQDRKNWAHIFTAYISHEYAGKGVGFALFTATQEILRKQNYAQLYLWALESNHTALDNYRRWGGIVEPTREKVTVIGGATLKEIAVTFTL